MQRIAVAAMMPLGAADTDQHVGAGIRAAGRDRARDVAVGDQLDWLPPRGRRRSVARAADGPGCNGEVRDAGIWLLATLRTLSPMGAVMSTTPTASGPTAICSCRKRPTDRTLRHARYRQHRDGIWHALVHQGGAVDGVDREVAFGAVAVADFLPL